MEDERPSTEQVQPVTDVEQSNQQPLIATAGPDSVHRSHKKLITVFIAVILLSGAGLAVWRLNQKPAAPQNAATTEQPATNSEEPKQATDASLKKFINPTTGETWMAAPKKINSLGYYSDETNSGVEYYEVGARAGKPIIMSVISEMGDDIRLYEKATDGTAVLVALPDGTNVLNEDQQKYIQESISSKVKIDTTIHYDSLTLPSKLELDANYSVTKPSPAYLGDFVRVQDAGSTTKYIDIKTFGRSKLQRIETSYTDTKLTSIGYRVVTPINTGMRVGYEPLKRELKNYQWQRGASYVDDNLAAISRGCGGFLTSVTRADGVKDAELEMIGRSSDGVEIYEFKDQNSPLLVKAYDEFVEFMRDTPDDPYARISKTDFVKEHGIVLHKDKSGQWLVYVRDELRPAYGCAKPVVYLYPQTVTPVTVKVGADVKISEPHYDARTGWKTIAFPNGKIFTAGNLYDSLFWEGPGIGQYPAVDEGVVVARDNALRTIESQLVQLGLNQKERADFIEYWTPKLPAKPYVRLTWLNTAQMNELAPLKITPKPDTVIRVFLDFAGMDEPATIQAQTLSAIPRNGFTVVEWGGLSPQKLYLVSAL